MRRLPIHDRETATANCAPATDPAEPPGREERGGSGSLRPFIRNVLLPGEVAKAAGRPGRPSGGPLARASGWLITVWAQRRQSLGGCGLRHLRHEVRLAGTPGQARCRRVWPGRVWPALVGDVCGPAVEVG